MNSYERMDAQRYARRFQAFAQFRLCDTRRVDLPQGAYFRKQRLMPDPFVAFANHVLGLPFEVLPTKDWMLWETRLYSELYGMTVKVAHDYNRTALLPALPGEVAGDRVAACCGDVDIAEAVFAAAVRSLKDLHGRSMRYPDGGVRPVSHGDATIWNVLYDARDGAARWFDFETVHRAGMSDDERQSDDLKVLLFSTASIVDRDCWERLISVVLSAYSRPQVVDAMRTSSLQESQPNWLRLKQVRMRNSTYRDFKGALNRYAIMVATT